jgi:hypothetical protein
MSTQSIDLSVLPAGSTVGDAVCLLPWVATLPAELISRRPRQAPVGRRLPPAAQRGLAQWLSYLLRDRSMTITEIGAATGLGGQGAICYLRPHLEDGSVVVSGGLYRAVRHLSYD